MWHIDVVTKSDVEGSMVMNVEDGVVIEMNPIFMVGTNERDLPLFVIR
jgi:hypothetical protein